MASLERGMTEPEWIDFGKSWDDFAQAGLNAIGTEVELVENYDRHYGVIGAHDARTEARVTRWRALIGSMNRDSGTCSCCGLQLNGVIVARYRQWLPSSLLVEIAASEKDDPA